jgi:U3 small nucleolar RNA-associated protein 10
MTELSKQLLGIKGWSDSGPASFLFDPKVAAKIDKDVIFTIGINGFEELRSKNSSFTTFFSELLDEKFANENYHSEKLLKSEIGLINQYLVTINTLISPYFLDKSCHKIYELLIRFYKIHKTIEDELIFSLLPFHGTKYFIRLIMICKLDGIWDFLVKSQRSGYVIQRRDIVKQCMHELSLLQGIINRARYSDIYLKFAGAVVIEVINLTNKLNETLMQIVLGFVSQLIHETSDHKDIAMAIIASVALRHNFSPQYLQGIITDLLECSDTNCVKELQCINLLLNVHVINI